MEVGKCFLLMIFIITREDKMIYIKKIQEYFSCDEVFVTAHAAERFKQRGISIKDIRHAVNSGEIIEQYPEDYPYPSCLILGKNLLGDYIHVVMSDEGTVSRIITAYFPDVDKWNENFKIRKD